jgi:cysteine desulfurase
MDRIYLDYNASTPVAPEVRAAMQPLLEQHWGNPSAGHWASEPAAAAIAHAREQVATLLGARPAEVLFTSGGSESNNHALKGVVLRRLREQPGSKPHVVVSAVEHPSVRAPCAWLAELGARITVVPVDRDGIVDPDAVRRELGPDTVLVSVMHAQNEVGTLAPLAAIAEVTRPHRVLLHTDAAQSVGKVPVLVDELGVDLLTVAGHKLYAPKGVGALWVRNGVTLDPLVHGGPQESGRRAGTESAVLAAALGAAADLARRQPSGPHLLEMRELLWSMLRAAFGDRVVLHGHPSARLPNTLNVGFVGAHAADVIPRLDGVAVTAGSACDAGSHTMSAVLRAMGVAEESGLGAIRFSVGRYTTTTEIAEAVVRLRKVLG